MGETPLDWARASARRRQLKAPRGDPVTASRRREGIGVRPVDAAPGGPPSGSWGLPDLPRR